VQTWGPPSFLFQVNWGNF